MAARFLRWPRSLTDGWRGAAGVVPPVPNIASMLEVVERGEISFVFQPKVERDSARVLDDVQRFFLVLHPEGRPVYRRIRVGRKRLPAPQPRSERFWALVEQVAPSAEEVSADLQPEVYETKTRGTRFQPGARPAARGGYAVIRHDDHVHLAYALESAREEVADDLRIRERGNFILLMRNPATPAEGEEAPRFMPLEPAILDQEGADLVLVGVEADADLSALAGSP
jgi:hypothetical protein